MAEPTLTDVFGASAVQTSTTLTLTKADFASVGLTASSTNTAESLFVAIILKAFQVLTENNRAVDPTLRNVTILYGGQDIVTPGSTSYRRDVYQTNLYVPATLATVDPDDY